jgi:hypothetical protein
MTRSTYKCDVCGKIKLGIPQGAVVTKVGVLSTCSGECTVEALTTRKDICTLDQEKNFRTAN